METVRKKAGENLRALILAEYRTVELFCHENGFEKGWLSRILSGETDPLFSNAVRLAEALGCTLNDIYPGTKRK